MERERVNASKVWVHFTKKNQEQFLASCNICNRLYSYRTSISNLRKHIRNVHHMEDAITDLSNSDNDNSDEEQPSKKSGATWTYFEILDSDKFEANCRICERQIHYDSVADLTRHVKEHGVNPQDSEDEAMEQTPKNESRQSTVWQYFNRLNSKMAVCLICKKILSYKSSISNLRKHYNRKHGGILSRKDDGDTKRVIISANGQLYEVDTTKHEIDDDDDTKDPINATEFIDTHVLDDQEDIQHDIFSELRKNSPKKNITLPTKRKLGTTYNKKEHYVKDSSSEDEIRKKRKLTKSMDRLDYFGQYLVSLLRELPKNASDQLQSDIIKQIISTKVDLEAQQSQAAKYAITISDMRNSDNTQPVTVTINNSDIQHVAENVMVESTENDIIEKE